jgi:hypothetical protein
MIAPIVMLPTKLCTYLHPSSGDGETMDSHESLSLIFMTKMMCNDLQNCVYLSTTPSIGKWWSHWAVMAACP